MKAIYIRPAELLPTTPRPRAPGEWRFVDPKTFEACAPPEPGQEGMLEFACPRRPGRSDYIFVGNGFKPEGKSTWQWNGSVDNPTLTPSINCLAAGPNGEKYAGCGWHDYLTNGEWGGA